MKNQEIIRCQSCGSSDILNLNNGTGKCNHCNSLMIIPKEKSEIISLLNSAYVYRETYNYDLAIKTYEYALEKDPSELSAYEGILLSEYGIEYVKDPYSKKLIPTCHRAHFKNIFENEYYKTLLNLANDDQKNIIKEKAIEINKLQEAIDRQLKNEQEFDVFISYKATDNNNEKTEDSIIAHEIYDELTKKNYRVFFAEKTLENRIGSEYEPIIFKALHTSKIFILVGTKKEYIESNWVRNEWSRYIDRIKSADENINSNSFIPVFKGMNPYDMPKVNNQFIQGVDASKIGYVMTVVDGVQRLLKPSSEKDILKAFDNVDNFSEFQKIRKEKIKEIKTNNWKDLQTNPKNKIKKIFYNTFLTLPIFSILATIILLCNPLNWNFLYAGTYIIIGLIIFTIILTTITAIIHARKFNLNIITQIILPYSLSIILTACLFIFSFCIPITLSGRTAYHLDAHSCSNGIYYFNNINETIAIVDFKSEKSLEQYLYEKDGQIYFELPEKINNKPVSYINYTSIPDKVDVLIVPKQVTRFYITIKKSNKLKTIQTDSVTEITIMDSEHLIYNDQTNSLNWDYFNFTFINKTPSIQWVDGAGRFSTKY